MRSRNAKIGQSLTDNRNIVRPQSRQALPLAKLSNQFQRAKHQSTGNFQMQFGKKTKAHHNPYESLPTTVVVKQSNTGDDSGLFADDSIDVLT